MAPPKYILSVTTMKPSSTLTPGGGGGCLTLIDPRTGSVLSSLRSSADLSGKTAMGISSLSTFPPTFTSSNNNLTLPAIAYGGNSAKKGDTYAFLISLRNAASPPVLHWKCRLPETEMTAGLLISPCGYYIVGGGTSGSCYIWAAVGGQLLRTFKAHYRSCTCLVWSACGRFLVTGGADGMVHMFSLMDLVDLATRNSKRTIPPLHTFSVHHFPVTCLTQLPSGRIVSAAEDGQLLVMELCSQQVLLTIQFPHCIQCLAHSNGRIFAGSTEGTIYSVDLNAYAMHQTEKQGATLVDKRRRQQGDGFGTSTATIDELVFGRRMSSSEGTDSAVVSPPMYQTDWVGHDHPVTAIALLTEDRQPLLISGDALGQVRIWDLHSRTCLQVLRPWSHSATASSSTNSAGNPATAPASAHPVSSIQLIPQPVESASSSMFRTAAASGKNHTSISALIAPLQKFAVTAADASGDATTRVPFLNTNRTSERLDYWEAKPIKRKRPRQQQPDQQQQPQRQPMTSTESTHENGDAKLKEDSESQNQVEALNNQVQSLLKELKEKQSQIERWEKVSNKLVSKLQANSVEPTLGTT